MKCPKCGKKGVRRFVELMLDIPMELEGKLSKGALRRKDVLLMGVDWERGSIFLSCVWVEHESDEEQN